MPSAAVLRLSFILVFILSTSFGISQSAEAFCGVESLTNSTRSIDAYNDCSYTVLQPATPTAAPTTSAPQYTTGQAFDVVIPPQVFDITKPIPTYFQLFESRNGSSYTNLGNISTLGETKMTRTLSENGPAYYRYRSCNSDGCSNYRH